MKANQAAQGHAARTIAAVLAAFGFWFLAAASAADEESTAMRAIADRPAAPGFDLAGPDGRRVRLSDFKGKPLIINFWATWCPPCRAEMPSLERAFKRLEPEGIGVVGINVGEDAETIRQFTAETPVTFPLPMDVDLQVVKSWPVRGLPTTFVVDPQGRLAYAATGEREWDDPAILDLVRSLKTDAK